MVSDTNTVFSDKSSKTDLKSKSQIIGLNMEIHGKFKESIFNIKSTLEVKSERLSTIKEMKDHIGKKLKLFWQEHMIPQFQAMPLLTLLVSDCGNQSQSINSISSLSTVEITTKP